jgi:NAD+ kinase
VAQALEELEAVAQRRGVQLLLGADDAAKHGRAAASAAELAAAQAVLVLGGDGSMIRALKAYGDRLPVLGINFGRVGFLTSASRGQVTATAERIFAGDYQVLSLPTLDLSYREQHHVAVNDVVVTSGIIGRLIRLGFSIDDEDQGIQPCDGLVSSTPSGSTAYNLSNGGPVLVWGLDAMVTSFIAPHSLNARPLVTGADSCLRVVNHSTDVPAALIVDGQRVGDVEAGEAVSISVAAKQRIYLGTLPEETFFRRYHAVFGARQ